MKHIALASRGTAGLLIFVGACCSLLLGYASFKVNQERACAAADTPYLEICGHLPDPGSQQYAEVLRARISSNPGDATGYVQLAFYDRSPERATLIRAAALVAPNEHQVLKLRAALAHEAEDWPQAILLWTRLADYYHDDESVLALARLIAGGRVHLMNSYVTNSSRWVPQVLRQLRRAEVPLPMALPLVSEAFRRGAVDAEQMRFYIRQLKGAAAWTDAYGLWLTLHGKTLPILYNSGFDDRFQPDGFDWEPAPSRPGRSGAIVERTKMGGRGAVLSVQFTGRAMTLPLIQQVLFLSEGRYRLQGEHMARELRMEQGLVWTVRCSVRTSQVGRSEALTTTAGVWRPFVATFTIPPDCGIVATLQLETAAAYEAATGARGLVHFDALTLEKLAP